MRKAEFERRRAEGGIRIGECGNRNKEFKVKISELTFHNNIDLTVRGEKT
jgi:hypothetical protein